MLDFGLTLFFVDSFMIQKLYALVSGDCCADNPDSPQHQEILLGGHLYMNYMNVFLLFTFLF